MEGEHLLKAVAKPVAQFVVFAALVHISEFAQASTDYAKGSKLLVAPAKLIATETGALEFDKKEWKSVIQDDGTELFTFAKPAKKLTEAKAAIMRAKDGSLQSMTSYELSPNEEASTVFFEGKTLAAFSLCENRGAKEIGRVCVTATPKLCRAMGTGHVTPEVMKEMDGFEMRSLAILLTLRGSDHQLENVVSSGNRLGLKSALQTTKGQLLALARQIGQEVGKRVPASGEAATKEKALGIGSALSKTVLERSIPRLKEACAKL